jgi:hypothetical protein
MNKVLKVAAIIAIGLLVLALIAPRLYNDLLDTIVQLLTSIKK